MALIRTDTRTSAILRGQRHSEISRIQSETHSQVINRNRNKKQTTAQALTTTALRRRPLLLPALLHCLHGLYYLYGIAADARLAAAPSLHAPGGANRD